MGSGSVTHPDLLPCHLIEEDIAPLLLLEIHLYRFGQGDVFGEPHLEIGVEPPVAIRSGKRVSERALYTRISTYSSIAANSCMTSRGWV